MRLRAMVVLSLLVLTSACAAQAVDVVDSGERYVAQTAGVEDYRLGVGDKVRMTVYNEPSLSGEFSVNAEGVISFPLIGDMSVVGKRINEISEQVTAGLGNGYLREPRVSMEITAYRPFFILGEVKAPGQYPYAGGLTALNAIATAQGFTPRAQKQMVYIRRAGSATEQAFRLTPELRVWPGDTIRLGERYF